MNTGNTATNDAVNIAHINQIYRSVRTFFRCAGAVGVAYFMVAALAPFAGKDTAVSLALSFLADVKFAITVALAGGAAAWAVVERVLRQQKTQYLQDRIIELETKIDPKRSTTGLTRIGTTNPNDRRR